MSASFARFDSRPWAINVLLKGSLAFRSLSDSTFGPWVHWMGSHLNLYQPAFETTQVREVDWKLLSVKCGECAVRVLHLGYEVMIIYAQRSCTDVLKHLFYHETIWGSHFIPGLPELWHVGVQSLGSACPRSLDSVVDQVRRSSTAHRCNKKLLVTRGIATRSSRSDQPRNKHQWDDAHSARASWIASGVHFTKLPVDSL